VLDLALFKVFIYPQQIKLFGWYRYIGVIPSVLISCNSSLTYELILMKLYTVAI